MQSLADYGGVEATLRRSQDTAGPQSPFAKDFGKESASLAFLSWCSVGVDPSCPFPNVGSRGSNPVSRAPRFPMAAVELRVRPFRFRCSPPSPEIETLNRLQ